MATFYPSLKTVINGNIIAEISDATVDWDAALNRVATQSRKLGYSKGTRFIAVSGTLKIPNEGPDFNPVEKMDADEAVLMQFFVGPLTCETEGVFLTASLSWSTDQDTAYAFTSECDWAPLK